MTEATASSYRDMRGKPGVVYILANDGLRQGWIKIGCSTRSAAARARDLNFDASTGTPGLYRPVYEVRTLDCGAAEAEVFRRLKDHRRGKWGQEFFEVDLALAKATIHEVCIRINRHGHAPRHPTLHVAVTAQSSGPVRPLRSAALVASPDLVITVDEVRPIRARGPDASKGFDRRIFWALILLWTAGALALTLRRPPSATAVEPAKPPAAKASATDRAITGKPPQRKPVGHAQASTSASAPRASPALVPAQKSAVAAQGQAVSNTPAPLQQPAQNQEPKGNAGRAASTPMRPEGQAEGQGADQKDENEKVPYPY